MNLLTIETINEYKIFLLNEEHALSTVEKYLRDAVAFYNYLGIDKIVTKEIVLTYKQSLAGKYKLSSINSMLAAVNGLLEFMGLEEYKVKLYRFQRRIFAEKSKILSKTEYDRLLKVAGRSENKRLFYLIQTICATGIRVSEHKYITVESLKEGNAVVLNKGKTREILIPKTLKKALLSYCKINGIKSGPIFVTRSGKAMNRSNIWTMMKKLCEEANVNREKVYPHNLRHLFAVTYYSIEKNLAHLADILGHSNIETTRIYIRTDSQECLTVLERMNLVRSFCYIK